MAANNRSQAQKARRARERMEKSGMEIDGKNIEQKQPTRQDIRDAAMWIAQHTNRIPTLWGPTATGKTYMINSLAQEYGGECVTVLLAQHTPDEIMGFQMPGKNNELVAQLPAWARKVQNAIADGRKAFILFDELNLAREEVKGAALTFFRDRTIHGVDFNHPDVLVFAAMNPGMLSAAYRSRACLLHVPADPKYLMEVAGGSKLAQLVIAHSPHFVEGEDSAYSNEPPPAVLQTDASAIAALKAAESSTSFWNLTPEARGLIVNSLATADAAKAVLGHRISMDGASLIREPEILFETIRSLPVPEALTLAISVVQAYATADKRDAAKAHAYMHEALYAPHDVDPELLLAEQYFFHAPESIRDMLQKSLDPVMLAEELAATGWVVPDKDGNPTGRLYERLQQAVKYNEEHPENASRG